VVKHTVVHRSAQYQNPPVETAGPAGGRSPDDQRHVPEIFLSPKELGGRPSDGGIYDALEIKSVLGIDPGTPGSIMIEAIRRPAAPARAAARESEQPIQLVCRGSRRAG
jgi:hypothetical protein